MSLELNGFEHGNRSYGAGKISLRVSDLLIFGA